MLSEPFYDRGPNDKGIGLQVLSSLGRVAIGYGAWGSAPRPPSLTFTQLTDFNDSAMAPALSPDGRMLAFIRSDISFLSPDQIWIKLLRHGEPVQLTNVRGNKYGPAFSDDGSRVAFTVAVNTGSVRRATIAAGGKTFTVTQEEAPPPPPPPPPPPCTFTISPTAQDVADTGGTGSVAVTASASTCAWTASANAAWLTVTSGASGTGNGSVAFAAAVNTAAARTGTLTIAGQTFSVSQAAAPPPPPPPPCTFTISPATQSVPPEGGNGSVTLTASAATCTWTSTANVDWLTVLHGSSGTGSDTVTFAVAPNALGSDRMGTITIAGQTFTVTQPRP